MKWLCVAALLVGLASAKLPQHLNDNKVPTGNDVDYTTTCDECKSIAKRFVDAVHDPAKLAELKIILSALCDETSYAAECKVIVNNLDKIVKKMEPFFADAEKVCKLFHLCSNSNLDKFHRVALLFAKRYINQAEGKNDLACDECIVAAGEVKKVVENVETQKKVRTFISDEVCRHLGAYQGTCDLLIEEFLPELFQELDKVLQDPKAACADVGFCAKPNGVYKKKAQVSRRPVYRLLRKTKELKTSEPQVLAMDCLTCKILVDGIILDLKTNESSYGIGQDIKELACPQLPAEWLEGCDDFLNLYAQTVVSMTVDQFTSEEVCEMLQSCDPSEYRETKAALSAMTKKEIASATCESCKGLSTLVRKEISQPGFAAAFESFFDKFFCQKHVPTTFNPLCENFSRSYVPRLVPHIAKFLEADNLCHC